MEYFNLISHTVPWKIFPKVAIALPSAAALPAHKVLLKTKYAARSDLHENCRARTPSTPERCHV
jgi:hypothetical protein